MRTTIILDDTLLHAAQQAVQVEGKTKLIHMGLQTLIQEAARKRLAKLHGAIRKARAPERRRTL